MKPVLTLIAAMDERRLLADERGIPWRLPRDIAHFRSCTSGEWLLLGRRTFREMLGWFREGHFPLVLSSQCGWDPPVGRVVSSVPHALALAEAADQPELVCCGGARTYAAALPYAGRLVLTRVQHSFQTQGQAVHFPQWDVAEWRAVLRQSWPADEDNAHGIELITLERAPGSAVTLC